MNVSDTMVQDMQLSHGQSFVINSIETLFLFSLSLSVSLSHPHGLLVYLWQTEERALPAINFLQVFALWERAEACVIQVAHQVARPSGVHKLPRRALAVRQEDL